MSEPSDKVPLDWVVDTDSVPDQGQTLELVASAEEHAAIARALDLIDCKLVRVDCKIVPKPDDRYHVTGQITAEVTQSCVVTLDPVPGTIEETFDVEFWPQDRIPAPRGGELDIDDGPEIEPLAAGSIPLGAIVFEYLASAIDLFPRKPDAVFEQDSATHAKGADADSDNPFAVLAQLKRET
jgi:uncharacterized metal-binding protein YceD (DUF177 family)